MDLTARHELVLALIAERKQARRPASQVRARSEQELYGPGPRLTQGERRRARDVERAIAQRQAMMATPGMGNSRRYDRPDVFEGAMRRRVRKRTGIDRDRGATARLRDRLDRQNYNSAPDPR